MIIGLSGKKQSGKSTLTEHLVYDKGFEEISWAEPLKEDIGRRLLGLTEEQLYGTEEDKETIDDFWGKSPRELLQLIGTECFRKIVDPDFWVKVGMRTLKMYQYKGYNTVVSDCRFPNEMDAIKKLGGISVRIVREDKHSHDTHESETALDNYKFDYIISAKSGDIDGLYLQMERILNLENAV